MTIAHRIALRFVNMAFLAVLLLAATAFAQKQPPKAGGPQDAALRGTVTTKVNDVPQPLPAVTVKLVRNGADEPALTADTDDTGHYEFKSLPPGAYWLSIQVEGFKSITKSISLNAGQQMVQDFAMELEVISEKVEVSVLASTMTTESSSAPASIVSNSTLVTLPTLQEKVKEVLPVTPGVVQTLEGKLVFKGSDENQSLLIVNSARNTDPVTGSFGITVPTDAVESFAVYKTPYDASLGSFVGGLTTIETKAPADNFDFNVRRVAISLMGKEGHLRGIAAANPAISFDGPLIAHKLLLSEAFQYDLKKTTVEGLPWPDDISKRQGFNSFTTLEAILSQRHVLTLTVNAYPLRTENIDISALIPIPASNNLNQSGVAIGLSDKYQFDSGASLSLVAQYTRFDSNAQGQGTADMLITPEGYGGNYFNLWSRRGKELQLLPSYQFAKKHWMGEHELRVGADVDWRSYFGTTASHPIHILAGDGILLQTISFDQAPAVTPSDTNVAEFVQDHWVLSSRLNLDLGARLSTETYGWPAAFAPRVGIAFSPKKEGKTVLRAGAGVFYGTLPLLAANWRANPNRTITEFDSTGAPVGPAITYTNAYTASVNPLTSPVLPSQPGTTPWDFTWNVGVAQEVRKNLNFEAGYIDSHTTRLFLVEPFTANGAGESFMGLTNTGSTMYREVEATINYIFGARDKVNASYIWSQTRGDLNSLSNVFIPFATPVIRPNVYGVLPSDIPNRFVGWAVVGLPWKMTLSPLVDLHTGFPYSPIDAEQQYVGTPNGRRFPTFFSLDMKLYREFRIPFTGHNGKKAHHIRLGVYTLNVTNHGNYTTVYNNVTSPNFGQFVGFLYRHEGMVLDFVD